jgi:flagellar protein FlbD
VKHQEGVVITLTRISGSEFVLNCDLIERVDSTPDTVVSLVDGKKYMVLESPSQVAAAVRRHRSEIIALSNSLQLCEPAAPERGPHPAPLANVAPLHREV